MFAKKSALESAQGGGSSLQGWQRYATLMVIMVGVVISLVAAGQIIQQVREQVRNHGFAREAGTVVRDLQQRVWDLTDDIDRLAAMPEHLAALQGSDDELAAHNRRLQALEMAGLLRVRLFDNDIYAIEPAPYPDLGYATLDLIYRAAEGSATPNLEFHHPGRPNARVEAVRSIADGEGFLVATFEAERLLRQLSSNAESLDIWQRTTGNTISRIQQLGRHQLPVLDTQSATQLDSSPFFVAFEGVRLWTPLPFRSVVAAALLLIGGVALLVAGVAWRWQLAASGQLLTPAGKGGAAKVEAKSASTKAIAKPDAKAKPGKPAAAEQQAPESGAGGAGPQPTRPHASVSKGLFRAYDIRGIVGKDLSEDVAEQIGHAIGSEAVDRGCQQIVVARDGRLSGPALQEAIQRGIMRSGADVIDIGAVPTGVLYFATHHLQTGCGVMVTGSHNPPDYNGFKIVLDGETLYGESITDLYDRIVSGRLGEGQGEMQHADIVEDYIEAIAGDVQLEEPIKVVADAGNGIAGAIAPRLLEAVGCEVIPLHCEVDGNFPNHHPDPSVPENLKDLIAAVKEHEADIGVAFDGDGDRLGVVTPSGAIIYPDRLLMLLAMDVLSRNPGGTVIYDVKCTGKLAGIIVGHGGTPMMYKTGHSLIKARMKETGAVLGGEMSGHFFIQERWYGFDDGIYSAARLLEVLAFDPRSPGDVLEALPDGVSTPELKLAMNEGEHHAFMKKFAAEAKFEGARITDIDGIRADFPDGWGLVRPSNTTPILVLRFEADDEEALERIKELFRAQLLAQDPGLELPF